MKLYKTISAILAVCMLAGSCITPAASADDITPADASLHYGDVNEDGSVDVADAVAVARYYTMDRTLLITDNGKAQGDVNLDGNLDDKDLTQILEFIARKRTVLGAAEQKTTPKFQAVNLTEGIEPDGVMATEADEVFLASQMKLTAELFKGAAADPQTTDNLLISPLSVSQALAMTANGAADDSATQSEMEKLLGDTLDIEALNHYYLGYTSKLTASDELHLANSLWIRDDERRIQVPKPFLQTAKDYYNADAFMAPFNDTTVTDVNNWVNENTNKMIPKLINEVTPEWIMLLINALAFDAEWSSPYTEYDVHDAVFHAYDGDMTVEMMYDDEYIYIEDEEATGFIKPYKGGNYSFAAVLPKKEISDYVSTLTGESLQKLLNSRQNVTVHTMLPKFKYDYTIEMNDMLKVMGMRAPFEEGAAHFNKLNSVNDGKSTFIDLVLHKTFIQVDERGTKAGAVTMVAMADNAAPMNAKQVYLDHPFIYMILDNKTNLPVFIGYVMHPTAVEAAE